MFTSFAFRLTRFEFLQRAMSRPRRNSERPERSRRHAQPKRWSWWHNADGSLGGQVVAFTRSHARSQIKAKLGIHRKRRLPIGFDLECVE